MLTDVIVPLSSVLVTTSSFTVSMKWSITSKSWFCISLLFLTVDTKSLRIATKKLMIITIIVNKYSMRKNPANIPPCLMIVSRLNFPSMASTCIHRSNAVTAHIMVLLCSYTAQTGIISLVTEGTGNVDGSMHKGSNKLYCRF